MRTKNDRRELHRSKVHEETDSITQNRLVNSLSSLLYSYRGKMLSWACRSACPGLGSLTVLFLKARLAKSSSAEGSKGKMGITGIILGVHGRVMVGGAAGVVSVRRGQGCTSGKACFIKDRKCLGRGGKERVRNSRGNTKFREEGGKKGAPGSGATNPLQPMEAAVRCFCGNHGPQRAHAGVGEKSEEEEEAAGRSHYGLTCYKTRSPSLPRCSAGAEGRGVQSEGLKLRLGKDKGERGCFNSCCLCFLLPISILTGKK